ncbi:MAG: putative bifunctional diguanylate cyclase/phosphodiesterase [Paracoccaceae bacterium]
MLLQKVEQTLHQNEGSFGGQVTINDVFGHVAGDHVLCVVAGILKDSVGIKDYIARVGGDEFAIAVVRADALGAAERIAQRIIAACKESIVYDDKELRFGASIGIALTDQADTADLMENADIALYDAKAAGRNRYALFSPELREIAEEKKRLADALLKGLADNQICPHFQPQVAASDGAFVGLEALARWRHPVMGMVSPGVFLPVAEELGLLGEIDEVILCKSLEMAKRLKENGVNIPKVSVNVSYRRLKCNALLKRLEQMRPWPCRLAFELLETIDFDQDADSFAWILDGLRHLGVEIELDDFGSGRASITTLLRLRPDRIKIDRQLVAAVDSEVPGAHPLIKAIGEMGKSIGIQMTAEGIESPVQARVLSRLGCDVFQGFLYSKPLSEPDLVQWIKEHGASCVPGIAGRPLS